MMLMEITYPGDENDPPLPIYNFFCQHIKVSLAWVMLVERCFLTTFPMLLGLGFEFCEGFFSMCDNQGMSSA